MSATVTLKLKNPDTDRLETRTFWVCARTSASGYVYDVTDQPGTLGKQVSDSLGDMMMCADNEASLERAIKRAQRRRLRQHRER